MILHPWTFTAATNVKNVGFWLHATQYLNQHFLVAELAVEVRIGHRDHRTSNPP
jgi:hypothetical protein